jgi:hypothetical protein
LPDNSEKRDGNRGEPNHQLFAIREAKKFRGHFTGLLADQLPADSAYGLTSAASVLATLDGNSMEVVGRDRFGAYAATDRPTLGSQDFII